MPNLSFGDGAVGLGIVAAMLEPRSDPIAIVSAARAAAPAPLRIRSWLEEGEEEEVDSMEMSESYTCVITHSGERRVYPGGGNTPRRRDLSPVLFFQSPPGCEATPHEGGKFLERCHLCGRSLLGIDIFMYRGERAFCSVECRCQQILMDEQQEKCRSGMRRTYGSSTSPCLIPIHLTSHVVAA